MGRVAGAVFIFVFPMLLLQISFTIMRIGAQLLTAAG